MEKKNEQLPPNYIPKIAKKFAKAMRKERKNWTPDDVSSVLCQVKALEKYPAEFYTDLEAQIIYELC